MVDGAVITILIPKLHVTSAVAVLAQCGRSGTSTSLFIFGSRHCLCLDEMAPLSGSDADYFRDKARRDLLTLLEGVRTAP